MSTPAGRATVVRVPAGADGPAAADLVRRVRRALRHGDVDVDTTALDEDTPAGVRAALEGVARTARTARSLRSVRAGRAGRGAS